ncbi:MaoC/PaaZ C-terminal domain-containing protein [Amycolatopsis sp.]|uniref:MaoC/PaaZ C-terminal domain-containing protein n=1 Tax=Amycolatopsis sp. TaxID=37632 RepID=UPI002C8EF8DB|nr:MaoC/PaaZ C-terminal domain-containing protein [Amycolatopsis sp.]HVV08263.1 MaoC/PaaZ C-terminal domain-containing protein [Amycolatopsis sp.]
MTNAEWRDPAGRWFEDFTTGDVVLTRGRTVDVGDLTVFAGLTGDHYPLHTDQQYTEQTQFKSRIAHGPLTFALAVGLVGMSGFYGDAIVALLGVDGLRARKPVLPGDTIRVRGTVIAAEKGNSGRTGAITVAYSVLNQREEEVMYFEQKMLAKCRTEEFQS